MLNWIQTSCRGKGNLSLCNKISYVYMNKLFFILWYLCICFICPRCWAFNNIFLFMTFIALWTFEPGPQTKNCVSPSVVKMSLWTYLLLLYPSQTWTLSPGFKASFLHEELTWYLPKVRCLHQVASDRGSILHQLEAQVLISCNKHTAYHIILESVCLDRLCQIAPFSTSPFPVSLFYLSF